MAVEKKKESVQDIVQTVVKSIEVKAAKPQKIDERAEYYVSRADGTGSEFVANGRTVKKTFANNPLFTVKKKK